MSDLHHDANMSRNGFDPLKQPKCVIVKSYRGERLSDGTHAVTVELSTLLCGSDNPLATTFHPLSTCLHLRSHSPMGFAWGYEGSGPAQLALALLVDALQDVDLALRWYQEFKREVVAIWKDSWQISERDIRAFIEARAGPNR